MAAERDKAIGTAVVQLRGDRTQTDLADGMRRLGWKWSQATVWSIESGERPLRLAEALDLSLILEARVEDLLQEPGRLEAARMTRALVREVRAAHLESAQAMVFMIRYQGQLETWLGRLGDVSGDDELTSLVADAQAALDLGPSDVAETAQRLHTESPYANSKADDDG